MAPSREAHTGGERHSLRSTRPRGAPASRRHVHRSSCGGGARPMCGSMAAEVRGSIRAARRPGVVGRELHQKCGALVTELVPARGDPLDPSLRRVELLAVCKTSRRLHRELKGIRQPAAPASKRRDPRPTVEAAVELDRAEGSRVVTEPVARRRTRRVQNLAPVVIAPARSADVNRHSVVKSGGRRAAYPGLVPARGDQRITCAASVARGSVDDRQARDALVITDRVGCSA